MPMPTDDDLVALANAVREAAVGDRHELEPPEAAPMAGGRYNEADASTRQGLRPAAPQIGARRHLRVVSGDEDLQR
ncbi:hypothetical protein J2S68_000661 [Glycomyces algeriensis]|nr:hypothetical protein [Glycomyces algeriensis]